ncbi:hypothetical protein KVT40_002737 [Elsinoe batatas]|uniref:C2H2-type domain-containing protein n=1 Tax=Elsinoe batatas TaxID=2601811 RepID=A0A8K0L4K7_9PEZI|nr:hypothetical protein KVT40_002737 [Elsinoe batatas]
MSIKVVDAIKDGYKIKHVGVFYKHDIPDGKNELLLRLLNKYMEAQLPFRLGGVISKDKDYYLGRMASVLTPKRYEGLDKKNASYIAEKLERKMNSSKVRYARYKAKYADEPVFQARQKKYIDDMHAKERKRGKYLPCKHAGCNTKWTSKKDMMRHYNGVHLGL